MQRLIKHLRCSPKNCCRWLLLKGALDFLKFSQSFRLRCIVIFINREMNQNQVPNWHHIQIKMSFKFGLVPSTDPDNPVNESDLKLF